METNLGPQARFQMRREAHARVCRAVRLSTVEAVAEYLKVSKSTVSLWQAGSTWPNGNMAGRILEDYDEEGRPVR